MILALVMLIQAIEPPKVTRTFLMGLAYVESGLDPKAEGDFKDGIPQSIGAFQIQEIYVDEVNRILDMKRYREEFGKQVIKLTGYPYFSYPDRWDMQRSKLMSKINLTYLTRHFRSKGHFVSYADMLTMHRWQYQWEPSCNETDVDRGRIKEFKKFMKLKLAK